jgi:hypothetical protein
MAKAEGNGDRDGDGDLPGRMEVSEELRRRGIAITGGGSPFAYRRNELLLRSRDLDLARRMKRFEEHRDSDPEPLEATDGQVVRVRVRDERQVLHALRGGGVRAQLNHVLFTDSGTAFGANPAYQSNPAYKTNPAYQSTPASKSIPAYQSIPHASPLFASTPTMRSA